MHDPHELCEGVGSRVPSPGCDQHPLLDRNAPAWAFDVARQGPVSDEANQWDHVGLINGFSTHPVCAQFQKFRVICACRGL